MAVKRYPTDWVQIEKDYRAGIKSNLQIAREHKISESAIRNKAKKYEWKKDLADSIRARAQQLVQQQELREEQRVEIDDSEVIESNAKIQADVIRSHRSDIKRYSKLCHDLLAEIELQTGNKITFEEFGEIMYAPDDKGQDKRNELYAKIISNPTRVDSVKKLVDTLKTLIALEREAFNLNAEVDVKESLESFLTNL